MTKKSEEAESVSLIVWRFNPVSLIFVSLLGTLAPGAGLTQVCPRILLYGASNLPMTVVRYRGHETVGIGIMQRPGSNAFATVKGIRAEMARLAKKFPPGITAFDTTLAVDESIKEVLFTLAQAIGLVVFRVSPKLAQ